MLTKKVKYALKIMAALAKLKSFLTLITIPIFVIVPQRW